MMTARATRTARLFDTRPRSGHTLVELVVSIAVSGILIGGLTSTLYVASRAVNVSGPPRAVLAGSTAAADVLGDLQYAVTFTERSATAVEFTVADRNADLAPETIRYAWSGTAGDPLTRQYNAGAAVTIVEDVEEFDLSYLIRTVTTTEMQETTTTSNEFMMALFEGWDGISSTPMNPQVCSTKWLAEFFTVSGVPVDADKLSITRVELQMRQSTLGSAGTFSVGIHDVATPGGAEPAANPTGTPYVASASSLDPSSFGWEEFTFSDVVISNPGAEYVIVVKGFWPDIYDMDAECMRYTNGNAPADDTVAVWTTDSGSSWDPRERDRDENDCLFRVWGTYETTGEQPVEVNRYFLNSVNVKLRVGSDAGARIDGGVQVLNAPEVPAP